jgi:hypothetical protein
VNPDKTSLQNAAIKKIPQIIFYKLGYYTPAILLARHKRFKVFSHYTVQDTPFRTARLIFKSGFTNVEAWVRK